MDSFKEEDDFETLISEDNPSEFEMQEQEVIIYVTNVELGLHGKLTPIIIIPQKKTGIAVVRGGLDYTI
jgi:hypothetical protein